MLPSKSLTSSQPVGRYPVLRVNPGSLLGVVVNVDDAPIEVSHQPAAVGRGGSKGKTARNGEGKSGKEGESPEKRGKTYKMRP